MIDLKSKIDELSNISKNIDKLKERKSILEADIIKQCSADLENTKYKSTHYHGTDAELTAINTESLKITYSTFLPMIFAKAYKDAVDEKTTYKLSAPATRMIIGLWKGNYIKASISDVIDQMQGVSESDRKQLLKKLKGKNYDSDVKNILKFSSLSDEDAKEYAYMVSEAAVWQDFLVLLNLNGITDEFEINDILVKIQSAFVVEDGCKISLTCGD